LSATAEATSAAPVEAPSPYLEAFAVGVRVAGVVIALAYLTGWLPGPLLAAAGGLALVTFGHALLQERVPSLLTGVAFASIVVALAAAALRWSTLDLGELRGIQAVLGPTMLVGPALAAAGAWTGAVACVLGIAVWLRFPKGEVWFSLLPWIAEVVVVALAVATVFWGPESTALGSGDSGELWPELGRWALVTASIAIPAGALSFLLVRIRREWTIVALALAAAAALSAVGLVASVL